METKLEGIAAKLQRPRIFIPHTEMKLLAVL